MRLVSLAPYGLEYDMLAVSRMQHENVVVAIFVHSACNAHWRRQKLRAGGHGERWIIEKRILAVRVLTRTMQTGAAAAVVQRGRLI